MRRALHRDAYGNTRFHSQASQGRPTLRNVCEESQKLSLGIAGAYLGRVMTTPVVHTVLL